MRIFIICASFFLWDVVLASDCELNNISCKFAAKLPYKENEINRIHETNRRNNNSKQIKSFESAHKEFVELEEENK